jgi:hypothetical protein
MQAERSEYYPPRARWYGSLLHPWFKLRHKLHLETIHLPVGFSIPQCLLSLVVPGFAFFPGGRPILGWTFLGIYLGSAVLFAAALGYMVGGLFFGLVIAAHASSIVFLEAHWLRDQCRFLIRLVLAGVTLLTVWLGVYSPLIGYAQRHWIMPLRVRGNVVIIRSRAAPHHIERGDWVMFALRPASLGDAHGEGGAVQLQAGFGSGAVLAVAGDHVEFSTNNFTVNGIEQPRSPHMPTKGEVVVPENHWFVWAELGITGHGYVSEGNLSTLMLEMAMVSEINLIGQPFKHWFWRRQVLS